MIAQSCWVQGGETFHNPQFCKGLRSLRVRARMFLNAADVVSNVAKGKFASV